MGEPVITRTSWGDQELVTVADPEWTETDRALVLAWLAEQKATCSNCGHPVSVCRDPSTAGRWEVVESQCEPGRVLAAHAENVAEANRRGVLLGTKLRNGG